MEGALVSRAVCVVDVTDRLGNVRAGIEVRWFEVAADGSLGALADVWDRPQGGSPAENPMVSDGQGKAVAWLRRGVYAWTASADGGLTQTDPEPFMAAPAWDGSVDMRWLESYSGWDERQPGWRLTIGDDLMPFWGPGGTSPVLTDQILTEGGDALTTETGNLLVREA